MSTPAEFVIIVGISLITDAFEVAFLGESGDNFVNLSPTGLVRSQGPAFTALGLLWFWKVKFFGNFGVLEVDGFGLLLSALRNLR